MKDTLPLLRNTDFPALRRDKLQTLQVNLGYLCNQQCLHCHVDASPRRSEIMDEQTVQTVIDFMLQQSITTLDLTGGAPEMNPSFRRLVTEARRHGVHVIDRCNLTIVVEPGYAWLVDFLAQQQVEVIASMPCYLQDNVDAQRGKGVYDKSIQGLQRLNQAGFGRDPALPLNLVYNPQGLNLPPSQTLLQADYKRELKQRFDIDFNQLFTIANMPIKRFGSALLSRGEFDDYMQLLKSSHQADNLASVMCRTLISVDWQGYVYDCDFNQMLGLPAANQKRHLSDLMHANLSGAPIVVMEHCYGCTAGQGSSCGGALA